MTDWFLAATLPLAMVLSPPIAVLLRPVAQPRAVRDPYAGPAVLARSGIRPADPGAVASRYAVLYPLVCAAGLY